MRVFLLILLSLVLAWNVSAQSSKQPLPHTNRAQEEPKPDERGTEKSPVVIKVLPPLNEDEKSAAEKQERQDKSESDWWLVRLTGVLGAIGVLQLVVFGLQARRLRQTVEEMKIATKANEKAADAAKISADAAVDSASTSKISMIASGRSYVHFNGCRWVSHQHIDDGHIFWRISAYWINSGNTPTRGLQIYAHFELRDNELPMDFKFVTDQTKKPAPITISPKGIVGSGAWDITGTDLVAISKVKKYLYIWGIAVYRDVFPDTKEHITKFCVFATNLTGDPLKPWHTETNPFDIAFVTYQRHNCADEDCEKLCQA